MRIGVFCLESGEAVATDKLMEVKLLSEKSNVSESDTLQLNTIAIPNVKKGRWIAGTMQVLDIRHRELFLNEEYDLRMEVRACVHACDGWSLQRSCSLYLPRQPTSLQRDARYAEFE